MCAPAILLAETKNRDARSGRALLDATSRGDFLSLRVNGRAVQRWSRFFFDLLALDALEDLFAVDGDFARGIDAEPHLIALHPQDGHGHVVADDDRFPHAPGQDQHSQLLLGPASPVRCSAKRSYCCRIRQSPLDRSFPSALARSNPLQTSRLTDLFLSFWSVPPASPAPREATNDAGSW